MKYCIVPLLFMLLGCVEKPFYHPSKTVYQTPERFGLAFEEVQFQSVDRTPLSGWFVPSVSKAKGTVIHFHGNAQNMTAHFSFVAWLPKNGFNVFVFDYRGYGASGGKPSHAGVHNDSVAALNYIKTRTDIDQERLIVIGQSLGGANALSAVGSTSIGGIRGVIVESAFSSHSGIAKDALAQTSMSSISSSLASIAVSDAYSPHKVVSKISPIPIVFIHGTADRVVPYKHVHTLYQKAKQPKQIWTIRNGRHLEAFTTYGKEVLPKINAVMLSWVQ